MQYNNSSCFEIKCFLSPIRVTLFTIDPCSPNAPECQLLMDPVCARKGRRQMVTFYNRCFFDKEVCFDPTLKFVKDGVCTARMVNSRSRNPGKAEFMNCITLLKVRE